MPPGDRGAAFVGAVAYRDHVVPLLALEAIEGLGLDTSGVTRVAVQRPGL